ncbi:sensor histidine kinase [Tenacibaculum jejuense]|uniref:histidine kinase n=1 Tax=Tenacibaculum jejuense TaxID=584609 RepID=A0A238UDE3_9FLAO|nr:ATP-binding protein [Tenacibaculum jejuense]SNR17217.1 Two-component system sensor histidine kinase [Tenacibaculum jejuense]
MNKRYILGICITVLVLGINQYFIQYWLKQKKTDANTINVAGKQRMLSQRIAVEFHRIGSEAKSKEDLKSLLTQWESAHELLKSRVDNIDKTSKEEASLSDKLKAVELYINFIKEQVKHTGNSEIPLKAIIQNQNKFLLEMDAIVEILEKNSDSKLSFIVRIEYLLFLLALLVLILEVFFIYRPIEKELKKSGLILKDKNEKLNHALEKIQEKNKELNEITYIASHDLQEPLRTVSTMVDMFDNRYNDSFDEQGKTMLGFINAATSRMRNLVKDLLEYSVLGQNKKITKVDCNEVLMNVKQDLSTMISKNNAIIEWNTLPIITAYKSELRLLFQNLISNAIKFQDPENQPKIKISSEDIQQYWKFKVSDNGIGIKEEYKEKIFSIFKRIHSKEAYEGTGIGLSHCKKIVEMHDGKLWVDSKEGEGSDFYFTIKKEIVKFNV